MHYTNLSFLNGASVIDDNNFAAAVKPFDSSGVSSSGFRARQAPHLGFKGAVDFPRELIYTRQEIKELIEEQDRTETTLWHILKRGPKLWRNQSPSNYCWMYATFHGMQVARIIANLPAVNLSPLSAGCPCDGFRNQGGWGTNALEWLMEYGACREELWPCDEVTRNGGVNRKYYTAEAKADALNYRIVEGAFDIPSRHALAKASAILRHMPVSAGYNWMGHQMLGVRVSLAQNGSLIFTDLDSYGRGGDFSQQALSESRGAADDMCVPRVAA